LQANTNGTGSSAYADLVPHKLKITYGVGGV